MSKEPCVKCPLCQEWAHCKAVDLTAAPEDQLDYGRCNPDHEQRTTYFREGAGLKVDNQELIGSETGYRRARKCNKCQRIFLTVEISETFVRTLGMKLRFSYDQWSSWVKTGRRFQQVVTKTELQVKELKEQLDKSKLQVKELKEQLDKEQQEKKQQLDKVNTLNNLLQQARELNQKVEAVLTSHEPKLLTLRHDSENS